MAYDGRLMPTGRRTDLNLALDGQLERLLRDLKEMSYEGIAAEISRLLDTKADRLGTERTRPVEWSTIRRYCQHYGI
jgi:hypothetical protein